MSLSPWRVLFALGGVFIVIGGLRHPRGAMTEMLAHEDWFFSHALVSAGLAVLLAGLLVLRGAAADAALSGWLRAAVVATALQLAEMLLHTAAYVDAANLLAGAPTPVLTTHLWLAVAFYPVFGAVMVGFIYQAARRRLVGNPWIAWIGMLGAAAHGASAPLVIAFGIEGAGILFPLLILVGVWSFLGAVTPSRVAVASPRFA